MAICLSSMIPIKARVHHPDVSIMAPLFFEGRLVAWAGVTAHQVDMGRHGSGIRFGASHRKTAGRADDAAYAHHRKRQLTQGCLAHDHEHDPPATNGRAGPERFHRLQRGGPGARWPNSWNSTAQTQSLTVMEELIRYSERKVREHLLTLPDGETRTCGYLDHDGRENKVYRTDVKIVKNADRLTIDMSDSSPQATGYINCTEGCLVGAVFGGVAPLLGSGIPWNQGILNSIEVIAPRV